MLASIKSSNFVSCSIELSMRKSHINDLYRFLIISLFVCVHIIHSQIIISSFSCEEGSWPVCVS